MLANLIKETIRKDIKNHLTYKFNILGEIFFNFILVFLLFYSAYIFIDSESKFLEEYNNNYFLFLLSGMIVFLFMTRTFSSIIFFIGNAQSLGYIESLFMTKTNFNLILLASSVFPILQGLLRVIIIFVFAFIFDAENLKIFQIFEILILLLFCSIPFIGFSLIVGSLNLIYKRASFASSIFLIGCAIFSGILYPVSVLPSFMQGISFFFPSTFAVNAIRGRIIEEHSYIDLSYELIFMAILGIVYMAIGLYSMRRAVDKAKQEGTLGQY